MSLASKLRVLEPAQGNVDMVRGTKPYSGEQRLPQGIIDKSQGINYFFNTISVESGREAVV